MMALLGLFILGGSPSTMSEGLMVPSEPGPLLLFLKLLNPLVFADILNNSNNPNFSIFQIHDS